MWFHFLSSTQDFFNWQFMPLNDTCTTSITHRSAPVPWKSSVITRASRQCCAVSLHYAWRKSRACRSLRYWGDRSHTGRGKYVRNFFYWFLFCCCGTKNERHSLCPRYDYILDMWRLVYARTDVNHHKHTTVSVVQRGRINDSAMTACTRYKRPLKGQVLSCALLSHCHGPVALSWRNR